MARINLLPWREELRKQQQQDFMSAIFLAVLVVVIILAGAHMYLEGLRVYQVERNKILQEEIVIVDKKIKEIKDIEQKKNKLLTKIEVIQKLQESRPEVVHLFEEIAQSAPEGIVISNFKQSGKGLTFTGKAQSNARVSAYMRAIDKSEWLKTPILNIIQAKDKSSRGKQSDFTMKAVQGRDLKKQNPGVKQ
jgi:type IV pilus assembly protein PilN